MWRITGVSPVRITAILAVLDPDWSDMGETPMLLMAKMAMLLGTCDSHGQILGCVAGGLCISNTDRQKS